MSVRIEALGGLRVSRDGKELSSLPAQPLRCALLVYLALEGSATREAAAGLLWSDREPSRARHSLSQTLYELKRDLGEEWLDAATDHVAVTEAVETDVARFRAAVEAGAWDEAIERYGGPFLGDVYLSAGHDFEVWADRLRSRLARDYRKACTLRAGALRDEGRWPEVLELARRWREVDRLEEDAWHHVIEGLARQGKRAQAIREYERLSDLLDAELDVEPVQKTRDLVARIRAGNGNGDAQPGSGRGAEEPGTAAPASAPGAGSGAPEPASRAFLRWTSPGKLSLAAAAVILISGALGWYARSVLGGATVAEGAERVAVVPFETSGQGVREFSEGIVNLVSWNLDEVGALRTVSPRSVLNAWRQRAQSPDQEGILQMARDLGAGSVLTGSVVAAGPEVRLAAELQTVDGRSLARVEAEGPGDRLIELVDTLCIRLLREVWRSREPIPNLRVSAISTGSIPATRHYLRGEYFFWRSRFDSAAASFRRAAEDDSTFALAHFRLYESLGWRTPWASPEELRALSAAYRHRNRLPAETRTFVVVNRLDTRGKLAARDSMARYVADNPFDAEGWFWLGDVRFHAQKAVPQHPAEILSPFERALELSPSMTRGLIHPLQMSAIMGDSAGYAERLAHFRRVGGGDDRYARWQRALWGPPDEAYRALVELLAGPPYYGHLPFLQGLLRGGELSAERIVEAYREAGARADFPSAEVREIFAGTRAATLLALGRPAEAAADLEWLWEREPAAAAVQVVEGALTLDRQIPLLDRAVRQLERSGPADSASVWLSSLDLSRGRVEEAASRITAALEGDAVPEDSPFRHLLRAHWGWVRVARGDTLGGLAEMAEALDSVGYGVGASGIRHHRKRILAARPDLTAEALKRLRFETPDIEFVAPRWILLGRELVEARRPVEAREAYLGALRVWGAAEPGIRETLAPIREAVERLDRRIAVQGEGPGR